MQLLSQTTALWKQPGNFLRSARATEVQTDLQRATPGIAGQQFTASRQPRYPGSKHVAATTDSAQKRLGILGKGWYIRSLKASSWNFKVEQTLLCETYFEIVDRKIAMASMIISVRHNFAHLWYWYWRCMYSSTTQKLIKINKALVKWKADETKLQSSLAKWWHYLEVNRKLLWVNNTDLVNTTTRRILINKPGQTLHYPRPFRCHPSVTHLLDPVTAVTVIGCW